MLHDNVDKALLAGGASSPRFGGGEILSPIELGAGDDREAGRGNRINGLITPFRMMTMESAAGLCCRATPQNPLPTNRLPSDRRPLR